MNCICRSSPGYWESTKCRPFTDREEEWALAVARRRHERSFGRDRDTVYAKSAEKDLAMHLMGARAELAWCILDGVSWPASVDAHRRKDPPPDVPPDIEIRCRSEKWDNIIIRDRDLVDDKLYRRFVAGQELYDGTIVFSGWIRGDEALRYPKSDMGSYGKPARFIPVKEIHRLPFYRDLKRHRPSKEGE